MPNSRKKSSPVLPGWETDFLRPPGGTGGAAAAAAAEVAATPEAGKEEDRCGKSRGRVRLLSPVVWPSGGIVGGGGCLAGAIVDGTISCVISHGYIHHSGDKGFKLMQHILLGLSPGHY